MVNIKVSSLYWTFFTISRYSLEWWCLTFKGQHRLETVFLKKYLLLYQQNGYGTRYQLELLLSMVNKENFFKGGYLLQIFFMLVKTSLYLVSVWLLSRCYILRDKLFWHSFLLPHLCCMQRKTSPRSIACAPNSTESRGILLEREVRKVKMACTVHVEKRQGFSCMVVIAILTFLTPLPMDTLVEKST